MKKNMMRLSLVLTLALALCLGGVLETRVQAEGTVALVNRKLYSRFNEALAAWNEKGGEMILLEDVSGDMRWVRWPILITGGSAKKPLRLNMNGYNIDRGLTDPVYSGYAIDNRGVLMIISDARGGKITGGKNLRAGGGIVNRGTLTIRTATVSGNESALEGGGVYNLGTLTITDGTTISGNKAGTGGGVYNNENGTLIIKDGSITGNHAESNGGGIYNSESCKVTVSGGTISGNDSVMGSHGIYSASNSTLTFNADSGKEPVIRDTVTVNDNVRPTITGGYFVPDVSKWLQAPYVLNRINDAQSPYNGLWHVEMIQFGGVVLNRVLVLPGFLTAIEEEAFAGNTAITTVVIPSSVTSIGDRAFSGCENLETVRIDELPSFGTGVFDGCHDLVIQSDDPDVRSWAADNGYFTEYVNGPQANPDHPLSSRP